jgi:drug/metabolite transporter (DMT)-like permease
MKESVKPRVSAPLGLAFGLIAVSFAGIIIKNCGMDAEAMAMFRMLGGGLALLPFAWPHLKRELPSLDRKTALILLVAGFFLAVHFVCWMEALKRTTVSSATMTLAMQPIFAAIIGHFFIGERFRVSTAIALIITIGGLVVIAVNNYAQGAERLSGVIMAVLAALFITSVISCGKIVRRRMHILSYSSAIFLIAGILLTPFLFKFGGELYTYSSTQWLFMAIMILVPTLMGHTLFYWSVKYIKVITINLSALTEPVIATIGAMFLVSPAEFPRPLFYLGGAVILAGVAYHLILESREKVMYVAATD